jgi:O-antigen/teichoic acid export membrane protein
MGMLKLNRRTIGGILVARNMMFRKVKQELTQAKTLLQFGFIKGTGQAFGLIAPFVIAGYFSRAELAEETAEGLYGSYSLAKMVVFFFSTLLIGASQAPFIIFANQEKVRSGRINKAFSVQSIFLVLSFGIFVAITLPLNKYIMRFAQITRGDLYFVLLAFVGLALKTFVCNLFMAMDERIKNSLAELLFGFLTLSLVLALCFTGTINLRTVFLVYLISGVALLVVFINFIDFGLLWPFVFDRKYLKDMFDFTKWVMLGSTAVYFINWGDNLVLKLFTTMEDIGTYNLGYQVFKGVATLTFIIYGYFLPFVSRHIGDSGRMRDYLYNKRPKILLLGLVAIGFFFVITPYVFRLICGSAFEGSKTVLGVLLIGSALILYSIFYDPILHSLKKYKFTQSVNVVQVLLNLVLDFVLVARIGMLGAAIGTVLAYFFRAATMEIYFRVKLKKLLNV